MKHTTDPIHYAIGTSALGPVLLASSARGLCALLMDDDTDAMRTDLRKRFPTAQLTEDATATAQALAQVIAAIDAPGRGLDPALTLDLRGTAFQQRVWQALREIPAGQTVSYSQLAERIGAPTAMRAVAGACAANPLAVLVPCHRVVGSKGQLTGYRWGVERKRALLEREV